MIKIPIIAIPNQSITFQNGDFIYAIDIRTVSDGTVATVAINDEIEISGVIVNPNSLLMPCSYGNNFVFTTQDNELINYENFNNTQELFFLEDGIDL